MARKNQQSRLLDAAKAAKALSVSRSFLFRLPKSTPGIFKFGAALRFDVAALRQWARRKSEDDHAA